MPLVCHRWCNIVADATMWPSVDLVSVNVTLLMLAGRTAGCGSVVHASANSFSRQALDPSAGTACAAELRC